jgi:PD-(D/E)XK endonuclease
VYEHTFVRRRAYRSVMSTNQRGNEAEAAVLAGLVNLGLLVCVPFGDGQPYDLVIDLETAFVRVQSKCGWRVGGTVRFNTACTNHGRGNVHYLGLADVFGVYFPPTRQVYIVPVAGTPTPDTRLRLTPARNNQRARVRMAEDYAIERWTPEALAAVVTRPARAGPLLSARRV